MERLLPPIYIRRILAWLSLDDLYVTCGTSKRIRYACMGPMVLYLHSKDVNTRCLASLHCCQIATDQNSMQDLVACDLIVSLMLMLQEGRSGQRILCHAAARALRHCYKYRPKRGNVNTDPILTIPTGSLENISETAESELLEECLRLSGLRREEELGNISVGKSEGYSEGSVLHGRPCFTIVHYSPALYAPSMNNILLSGIHGRPSVIVIERSDTQRRLMYLGTFYLEGFCESEAEARQLGRTLFFWYAKAVVSTIAAHGCLTPPSPSPSLSLSSIEKKKILILGLGAGVLPAFIERYFPHVEIDVCEINQSVVDASINGFGLKHLAMNIYIDDCFKLVKKLLSSNERHYDGIVCDVYGDGGMPRKLCDIVFLGCLKKLIFQKNGIVVLNCGHEMDHYSVIVNNFNWIFGNNNCYQFGHPDEENRLLVGTVSSHNNNNKSGDDDTIVHTPSNSQWKDCVKNVIHSSLFEIFLIQKINLNDTMKNLYYMTFLDQFGICANDSLSVNASKLQDAIKGDDNNYGMKSATNNAWKEKEGQSKK
jgi:spermidine synthase